MLMAERDGAKSGIRDMVAASKGYLYRRARNEARSTNASLDHVTGALSAFNKIRFDPRALRARPSLSTRLAAPFVLTHHLTLPPLSPYSGLQPRYRS